MVGYFIGWYGKIVISMLIIGLILWRCNLGKILIKFSLLVMVLGLFVYFIKDSDGWQQVYESEDKNSYVTEEQRIQSWEGYLVDDYGNRTYNDGFEIRVPEDVFYWRETDTFYSELPVYLMNAISNENGYIKETTFAPIHLLITPIVVFAPFVLIYMFIASACREIVSDFTGIGR